MPIASFGEGLQKAIAFFPGTYGTSLLRNHSMRGVLSEMQKEGLPEDAVNSLKDGLDCNIYFFDNKVDTPLMYIILVGTIALLLGAYIILNALKKKEK